MRRITAPSAAAVLLALALTGCSSTAPHHAARASAPHIITSPLSLPSHTDNPSADAAAAAILNAENAKLAAVVAEGKTVIGTSAQVAWSKGDGDPTRLQTEILTTFKTADANFTAADEPDSITAWRNTSLPEDVLAWYMSDTGSGPSVATTTAVENDLTSLQAAAAAVAKGQ